MAITQNPITGRTRGKFGNAVFSTQFGLNVLKSKPLSVANPRTTAQRVQRAKMGFLVQHGRSALAAIRIGFRTGAAHMSAWNRFIHENLHLVDSSNPDSPFFTDETAIQFSQGSLPAIPQPSYNRTIGTGPFTWTSNANGGTALATDKVVAVVLTSAGTFITASNTATRSSGTYTPSFPGYTVGANTTDIFYLITYRESDGSASDTLVDS